MYTIVINTTTSIYSYENIEKAYNALLENEYAILNDSLANSCSIPKNLNDVIQNLENDNKSFIFEEENNQIAYYIKRN